MKRGEGIKKNKHIDSDNSMVVVREKGLWGRVEEGRNGDRTRLYFGQWAHDAVADGVFLSCTLEACTVLLANVIPNKLN